MNGHIDRRRHRTPTMERALALLLMVDERDAADGPIIAELAAQLGRQMARGDVHVGPEQALVSLAVSRARQQCAICTAGPVEAGWIR